MHLLSYYFRYFCYLFFYSTFFSQQGENPLMNKTKTCLSLEPPMKVTNRNALIEVKKSTFMKVAQNEKSVVYNIYNLVFFFY